MPCPAPLRTTPRASRNFLAAAALAVMCAPAFAEVPEDVSAAEVSRQLPPVVVVAPPLVQSVESDTSAAAVTTVSRGQIEALNAMDIGSTLRTVPGVTISRRGIVGSYGGSSGGGIFIRGLGASRPGGELVTLYDGVPRINPVFSHPLLDLLSTDAADSVRIHKGAMPALFGNGFAAIDIAPRFAPAGRAASAEVAAAYGTDDTVVERVAGGAREGKADFYAGQSLRRSDGHRPNAAGQLVDWFLNTGYGFNENWRLALSADFTNNYAEDPGDIRAAGLHQGNYHSRDGIGVLTLANAYDNAAGHLKFYYHNGHAVWRDQGMRDTGGAVTGASTDVTDMDWDSYGVRGRETLQVWDGGELVAGADVDVFSGKAEASHYGLAPVGVFPREDLQIYSPYAAFSQFFGDADGFYARPSAGLRYYAHNVFDTEVAPHAGVVFGHTDTELRAVYARGVNYPGLNVAVLSALMPSLGTSWRGLDAETVDHFEAGVSHQFAPGLKVDVAGFYDHGKNRYVMLLPFPPTGFANIGEYHNRGVEASVSWSPVEALSVFAGGTWLRTNKENLPFAPEWSASAGATWRFWENFRLSVDLVYQGSSNSFPDGYARNSAVDGAVPARVPAIFLINAKLSWEFEYAALGIRRGEVFLAGENLTDRDYYYQPGYPMPGIGGMLGVKAEF